MKIRKLITYLLLKFRTEVGWDVMVISPFKYEGSAKAKIYGNSVMLNVSLWSKTIRCWKILKPFNFMGLRAVWTREKIQ